MSKKKTKVPKSSKTKNSQKSPAAPKAKKKTKVGLKKDPKKTVKHPLEGKSLPAGTVLNMQGEKLLIRNMAREENSFVLFFYPKDNTPGCTQEACDFRDSKKEFQKIKTKVFGISPDSLGSHEKFIEKNQLNFPLLIDHEHKYAEKIGVWQEKSFMGKKYMGIVRSTFWIHQGKIKKVWQPVRVRNHVTQVLEEIQNA